MTTPALVPAGNIIADPALKSAIETGSVEPHQGFHALMRLAWGEVLALLLPPSAATKGEPGHVKSFSGCLEQRIIQLSSPRLCCFGEFCYCTYPGLLSASCCPHEDNSSRGVPLCSLCPHNTGLTVCS